MLGAQCVYRCYDRQGNRCKSLKSSEINFCFGGTGVLLTLTNGWTRRLAFAVGVIFWALCMQASAQQWSWTSEKVGRGLTSSIALDPAHNVHVTYLTKEASVYYAFRPLGASKWFYIKVVDSTHSVEHIFPRVTVDNNGSPHLCVGFGVLLYIALQNQKWVTQEIDPHSGTLSYHCSVAVGPDGTPHLSWYHEYLPGGKQYTHFRHAGLENGVWVVRSVDGGISGKWNSMVIDSKGFPHASYSQWAAGGDLRYAEWDGTSWNITTVDSSNNSSTYRGFDNSLALAPDGSAHISYFDARTLKYAHQNRGKWVIEKVDVVAPGYDFYGGSTTMLLDSHGNPHIIYGDFGAVKHAFWDGKKWQIETVVSGAVQQYNNVDAAIGPKDTLYVSYPDPEDGFVKVATGRLSSSTQVTKK